MIKNISILHLVSDEKFIDIAYKNFESVAPSCNTFFVPSWDKKLKYIKNTPVKFINPFSFKNPFFMKSLEKYDFIMLHSLNTFNQRLLANANPNLTFVWIGYGYDYYNLIYEDRNWLYQEQTKAIIGELDSNQNSLLTISKQRILRPIGRKIFYNYFDKKAIVEKINFFAPVLENEYNIVASIFGSSFPEYVAWNYGSPAAFFNNERKSHCNPNGNNILIGNSAKPTNNHIEVFDLLRTRNIGNRKIICPLSYGNSDYASVIKNRGKSYFGESFLDLDTFMPYEEYTELIGTCSNVIMNHHRQQAVGNIVVMLALGANVFLNKINPLYSFLKEKGAVIFSIDELFDSPDLLDSHLSEVDIEHNRQILLSLYGQKVVLNKIEKLINKVISSTEK
ncbi:TDP-N-acetylfucosamine:lipid II N-acetylfucosaminyltransferase [Methanofollis fontis]|uniref:4-alpha-L-fucosyltransferase n=1 Tax=Methanofollis fontis TaxID=2052832 RepID=A0A483CVZ7_9EURY|nr:TDP-N-acetylfucosamine:lipid II N-acetylfucosaminyltransferase [Methanofollis fontis]TAJ43695.1 hypothetical protein CUJ86_10205 [Methanofollis fontis]